MLEDNLDCQENSVSLGRCKRDYETEIKRARLKLEKITAFRDATIAYLEGTRVRDKMAELIGELVMGAILCQKNIDSLIAQQEANKE